MAHERPIETGGMRFVALEEGVGGRPLLLLHGWTGSKEDFADWIDPLAGDHFHVVAPDQRGHGHTSKPSGEDAYSVATYAHDAIGLADRLGWERFCLLGHSMGGMIAQEVALRIPGRLDALVLMDTHHGAIDVAPSIIEAGIDTARTQGTEFIADMMSLANEPGPLDSEAYRRVCAERPGHFERGIETTRLSSSAMFAAMLEHMAHAPSRLEALRGLEVPTLVLVGEQDTPFMDASVALAGAIPGARLEVIADAGHSPQFEAPQAWWDAMVSFLGPARQGP